MPIAGQLMGERTHITGALHIILPPQRVYAHAVATNIAGQHGQVGNTHNRSGALAVLCYTQAIEDRAIAACGIEPRRSTQICSRYACDALGILWRMALVTNKGQPLFKFGYVATLFNIVTRFQPLVYNNMG